MKRVPHPFDWRLLKHLYFASTSECDVTFEQYCRRGQSKPHRNLGSLGENLDVNLVKFYYDAIDYLIMLYAILHFHLNLGDGEGWGGRPATPPPLD